MTNTALLRLIAVVFTAVTSVSIGDAAGKLLTSGGMDPVLVAWSRFVIAACVLLPFSGLTRPELPSLLQWRVLVRAAFITGGISCILTALKTEPIANVFGAFFIGPVISYCLAILFLGEKPTALRSALLAVGFFGVMLVVKPGFGTSVGMIFALGAGTFYGAYLVMTRTIAANYRPRFLLISQLLIGSVLLTPLGLSAEVPNLSIGVAGLVLLSALASAFGNYLLVIASKSAEASLISPLVYSQLLPVTVLGIVVFGDWPDTVSLIGILLIAMSGVGSLLASRRRVLFPRKA